MTTYSLRPGVNLYEDNIMFQVDVQHAKECSLRLYDSSTGSLLKEYSLSEEHRIGDVFALAIPQAELVGDCYRYRSRGKEFIDPYAKRILGREVFGEPKEEINVYGTWDFNEFDWGQDRALQLDYNDCVLYKLHVRGYTMHPSSGVKHRGRYQGIVEKIPYLKSLGVNALLLMPCVEFNEISNAKELVYGVPQHAKAYLSPTLGEPKLNCWGYTTDAFYFAPKASYASEPNNCIYEMKEMVKLLHWNGIEVLLDMHFPPDLSLITVLEVLRFWKMEYHMDGFLINGNPYLERLIATDSYLARTKLLSAGWDYKQIYNKDVEPTYRNLAEYNDGFMTDIRRFLKADEDQVQRLIQRFKKNPAQGAVINYLADQNGFTLADLYSYDVKHNEANGENNHDGSNYNYSWNCGVEGKTTKKAVNQLRQQMICNALSTLLLSQGTPMLQAGDEFGNSQQGNNNAYCQDNELGWVDWKRMKSNKGLLEFVKNLIIFRMTHPVFHNSIELKGLDYIASGYPDISFHGKKAWYPDYTNYSRNIGIMLNGEYAVIDPENKDATCYLLFNMHWEAHCFDVPDVGKVKEWELVFTSADGFIEGEKLPVRKSLCVEARSIALLIERKKN